MEKTPNITSRLSKELQSCRIDKEGLTRLCLVLEQRIADALNLELQQYTQAPHISDEVYEDDKRRIREAFVLQITVNGKDNSSLFGTPAEVLASPNFPDDLASFYANSSSALRGRYNFAPRNYVEIYLDFTRPQPLDFNWLPSRGTENGSNFKVEGQSATWTNGLFRELETFFQERNVPLKWLHKPSVWDAILWLVGMPISLWVCYRFAPFVEQSLAKFSTFLEAAAYIYIVVVSMNVMRAGFHYARWLWPRAEYVSAGSSARRHRFILGAIATSIAATFIYDIVKIAAS